jgi:GGDEF domain-containing protein
MTQSLAPSDERTRLSAVRSLGLLDTEPEERFDRVTRLARQLFNVPTALVSLVDERRQWFKSVQGFNFRETPREISFCAHAVSAGEALVVEDAQRDARFASNPLVVGQPKIRFYAGYPLAAPDGSPVGTLCVIGDAPRQVSSHDLTTLRALANMIQAELVGLDPNSNDPLTGISNRRGFIEVGKYILSHSRRLHKALQAVGLHVEIGSAPGSTSSPATFAALAALVHDGFRNRDLVGRLGDRQLGVLLSCPPEGVRAAVERMNRTIQQFNIDRPQPQRATLTVSHAAYDPARHQTVEDLVAEIEEYRFEAR